MAEATDFNQDDKDSNLQSTSSRELIASNTQMVTRSQSLKLEKSSISSKDNEEEPDLCPVCLEDMIHPVKLPCSHVFCFLCIKGVSLTNGNLCPLCRGKIDSDFFIEPVLATPPQLKVKKKTELKKSSSQSQSRCSSSETADEDLDASPGAATGADAKDPNSFQWFYEGRNGWWRYDARTNAALEEAYSSGVPSLTLMLAGHNFCIDLSAMRQRRADGGGMSRNIKRDSDNHVVLQEHQAGLR
ncbi:E3 ubiquitin-protein ligase rnf146 isoform X2 [Hyalella azteca]|uniref:E3 ubiquitin-protein ligase n=1 Tax=Hyalella azteca TaxID=294128 RepID=A0A979FUR6_HYAAZ|nr:E3 ubiquitin-protein ligase rnf146 isoform X2 [Hyalella azteca]